MISTVFGFDFGGNFETIKTDRIDLVNTEDPHTDVERWPTNVVLETL